MPTFEGRAGGVLVKDDEGRVLGTARSGGRRLSSEDALAQLGYEAARGTATGVRRIGSDAGALEPSGGPGPDAGLAAPTA